LRFSACVLCGLLQITKPRDQRPVEGFLHAVEPVPVRADCTDGFTAAYWRRSDAYLDEAVRANMSTFALLDECLVAHSLARLTRDLADRSWHRRCASLLTFRQLDVSTAWSSRN
jgi:hypothetical protein